MGWLYQPAPGRALYATENKQVLRMMPVLDVRMVELLIWVLGAPVFSMWTGKFRVEWYIAFCLAAFIQVTVRRSWLAKGAESWKKVAFFSLNFVTILLLISTVSRNSWG